MIGREIPPYMNPADRLIKFMHTKEHPDPHELRLQQELYDNYDKYIRPSIQNDMNDAASRSQPLDIKQLGHLRASTFWEQYKELMTRAFRNLVRNVGLLIATLGQTIILALVLVILFWNKEGSEYSRVRDKNGAFFFISITQFVLSIQAVLLTCTAVFECSSVGAGTFFARAGEQNVYGAALLFDEDHGGNALSFGYAHTLRPHHLLGHPTSE